MTTDTKIAVLRTLITNSNGRIFSITFRKRTDGTMRQMRARTRVVRNINGRGQSYDPLTRDLVTVWEIGVGYKNVPLDAVTQFKMDKHTFNWSIT